MLVFRGVSKKTQFFWWFVCRCFHIFKGDIFRLDPLSPPFSNIFFARSGVPSLCLWAAKKMKIRKTPRVPKVVFFQHLEGENAYIVIFRSNQMNGWKLDHGRRCEFPIEHGKHEHFFTDSNVSLSEVHKL